MDTNRISGQMPEKLNARLVVSGVVQMVGFRYFTARLANEYGLTGWVRNRPDGKVEIEAEGDKNLLMEFLKEVQVGPLSARVTAIDMRWGAFKGEHDGFRIM